MEERLESQPLAGVRVLDLTHGIAGPYGTKLLADFGADVIKVERPGTGDFARSLGPFPGDVPHPEKSGFFLHLNTDKRSVVLDLKTAQGVQVVKDLARDADVVVESFKPGVMERLGLSYEVLSRINPNLLMTSISNFGQTGPYRDYLASELTLFATGGVMYRMGLTDRYPLQLTSNHVQYQAGNVAAMAILFAWYAREDRGFGGQFIDVSMMETQMGSINGRMMGLVQYQYTGERVHRLARGIAGGYPSGFYPCQDGYVNISAGFARWASTVALLKMPELLNDPRFNTREAHADPNRREEFEGEIWIPWLLERTKMQVVEECQAQGVLASPVNTIGEGMDDFLQAEFREFWVRADHPVAGSLRYPGAPIYAPRGWWRLHRPAPLLGEHTLQVLKKGWGVFEQDGVRPSGRKTTPRPVGASNGAGATPSGQSKVRLPLEGIRILDMTMVWAGPYGSTLLADMGAEVIRLESRGFTTNGGRIQPAHPNPELEKKAPSSVFPNRDPGERPWNRSSTLNAHTRNKSSITVDMTTPEGKDVFRRLVKVSDFIVQNNAVGSMERLGITWDLVSRLNPRFSMINVSGMGQNGPWREYRGFGYSFEGFFGFNSIIGYPDMEGDGIPTTAPSDASTGVTIATAAVLALRQRERTGKGCYVDISLGETFAPHLGEYYLDYEMNHRVAGRLGNRHATLVQNVYPCAGEDEWITLCIGTIGEWHTLCRLMGRPELIEDERFADMKRLRAHQDEADIIIGAWTADKDSVQLFHRLQKEGVVAGPMLNEPLAYADPHMKARDFFVQITHPEVGTHLYPGAAYKMSKVPFLVRKPPVRLGEDNDHVYRDVLKLTEAEYDHLKALGHIGMDYLPGVP